MARKIVRTFSLREEQSNKKVSDAVKKYFAKNGEHISTHEVYLRAVKALHFQLGL